MPSTLSPEPLAEAVLSSFTSRGVLWGRLLLHLILSFPSNVRVYVDALKPDRESPNPENLHIPDPFATGFPLRPSRPYNKGLNNYQYYFGGSLLYLFYNIPPKPSRFLSPGLWCRGVTPYTVHKNPLSVSLSLSLSRSLSLSLSLESIPNEPLQDPL